MGGIWSSGHSLTASGLEEKEASEELQRIYELAHETAHFKCLTIFVYTSQIK